MAAKFCRNDRCSRKKDTPCPSSDDCNFFIWDIDRQLNKKPKAKATAKKTAIVTPLEEAEQRELAMWLDAKGLLWAHIPNERKASAAVMAELEREGMKKGFPDNFIAEPRGIYHGLFIELKRAKKSLSRKSPEQRQWITALEDKGYKAAFCYGAEEAKRTVLEYLQGGIDDA